ncbi:methyl-accepting chemotaxis protein [Sorangium sp. So ce131]|uniref:methyl-accepting chemotaxis protein n=1 Tax=Sorangium sp. So ce131 TaxID=3133282 RepID=UPI003F5DAA79
MLNVRSIRWKIAALVASVAIVLSALDLWLIPARTARASEAELRERAEVLATMLKEPIGVAMDLEQPPETFPDTLRAAMTDPLVSWVAVYDERGARVASIGAAQTPGAAQAPDSAQAVGRGGDASVVASEAPITSRSGERRLGTLAVGLRSDRIAERRADSRRTIALQSAGIMALGLGLAWVVSARMTRSMAHIKEAADRIARGDVSARLSLKITGDELGDMASAFERMNAQLRELQETAARVAAGDFTCKISGDGELFAAFRAMVASLEALASRIGDTSSEVASAAAGMFSSVRERETTAGQQNAALEEIRRTVEALTASADHIARDAATVRAMAQQSLVSVQRTAEQTRLVSAHSGRIGEILSLIQSIADKSDLLALNAALEGTKAGEVGRGFSLVAAEMRRLSEHVMDSVRDIRKLVADMHAASHASVLATEDGIKLARDTAAAAAKISDAVDHQREGTARVKTAIVDIVGAVNDTLTSSADATRAAESLLQLSHELKAAARAFRVREAAARRARGEAALSGAGEDEEPG